MAIIEKDNCGCGFIASINGKASHRIIKLSLTALQRLTHRGAAGEDGLSADGCGVMIQLPELFFRKYAKEQGWHLNPRFAVGMCFLNPAYQQAQKEKLDEALNAQGFSVAGWRDLPVDSHFCGAHALGNLPHIAQVLVNIDGALEHSKAEAKLMLARHQVSTGLNDDPFFIFVPCQQRFLSTRPWYYPNIYLPFIKICAIQT